MPARPRWQAHLPEILSSLAEIKAPRLDRAAVEQLFSLSSRQALRLMARLEPPRNGVAGTVSRDSLAALLDELLARRAVQGEIKRRRELAASLRALEREAESRTAAIEAMGQGWPEGVRVVEGELCIAFRTPEDLLGRILAFTEAAASDLDGFAAKLEECTVVGAA